jgi:hypothetical protein
MIEWLLTRSGVLARVRSAVNRSVAESVTPIHREVKALRKQVEALDTRFRETASHLSELERLAFQTRDTVRLNLAHAELLAQAPAVLDAEAVVRHVQRAVAAAPLATDPFPYLVVDNLLPKAVYKLLLKALPPPHFFGGSDPVKQNIRVPLQFGPMLTMRVLEFLDAVIARDAIVPAVVERLRAPLRERMSLLFDDAARSHTDSELYAVSRGRLMLRRPGYHLPPHRDPKRTLMTCLIYLARSGDSAEHGTALYRVAGDCESSFTETYYPQEDGRRCELAAMVPFRANSMLAFVNGLGAHGATIPTDQPASLERYSYQFYVGPEPAILEQLIARLAPARRALWVKKNA